MMIEAGLTRYEKVNDEIKKELTKRKKGYRKGCKRSAVYRLCARRGQNR